MGRNRARNEGSQLQADLDCCADRPDSAGRIASPGAVRARSALQSRPRSRRVADRSAFRRNHLRLLRGRSYIRTRKFQVFTNGENYYAAELAAIQQAKRSINIEAYIFSRGEVAEHLSKRWPSARRPAFR